MPKLDQKSSSRSTSSSDRSSQNRGFRVDQMLNILSQNYADINSLKKRKFSQQSSSTQKKVGTFEEFDNSDDPSKRFQSFMEKKESKKLKYQRQQTSPQKGEFKTESPRKEKPAYRNRYRIQKSLSFLERMMLNESAKRALEIEQNNFEEVISISQRDLKLDINNFCVFRSPHCNHSNSCLNNLITSTFTTGLKASTLTFLWTLVSKRMFPSLQMSSQVPYQMGVLASLIHFCSSICNCLFKGLLNKASPLYPIIGCLFSSWGLLIFPKSTRKNIVILSLTVAIDFILKKYLYTQENRSQYRDLSFLQTLKKRIQSKKVWLQMGLFVVLLSISSMFSTHIGLVARRKLDIFGRLMKRVFGWK